MSQENGKNGEWCTRKARNERKKRMKEGGEKKKTGQKEGTHTHTHTFEFLEAHAQRRRLNEPRVALKRARNGRR